LSETVARLYGQALSTASELQRNIETGAKNAGIPIEEYKRQANQAVAELRARATEAANYLEANAKNARVPVDEYMRQANQAVEELRGRAADAAKYLETSAKNAGIPVDEYIRQANATIEELRARAAETARYLDGKSKEVRGKAGKASEGGVSLGAKAQEVKSKGQYFHFFHDVSAVGPTLASRVGNADAHQPTSSPTIPMARATTSPRRLLADTTPTPLTPRAMPRPQRRKVESGSRVAFVPTWARQRTKWGLMMIDVYTIDGVFRDKEGSMLTQNEPRRAGWLMIDGLLR
jgi:ElaB/YqjD/DUF883 family membrane-anchored ribosome-binding protein